jgi:hypothetical protein
MASPITIGTIRTRATDAGSHWFDRDTLSFWGSRILPDVYEGADRRAYFCTSETDMDGGQRRYSVRVSHPDGRIDTIGDFRAYDSQREAHLAAFVAAANDAASA